MKGDRTFNEKSTPGQGLAFHVDRLSWKGVLQGGHVSGLWSQRVTDRSAVQSRKQASSSVGDTQSH
jgi:hypothetical protein